MALWAVGLSRLPANMAPLGNLVAHVVSMGPRSQVGHLTAGRVVAYVVTDYDPIGDGATDQLPGKTVGRHLPAVHID